MIWGAKYIGEAITFNIHLKTLDISFNRIGDKGSKYISDALEWNQFLTTLHLSDNNIHSYGILFLTAALQINQTLTILDFNTFDSLEFDCNTNFEDLDKLLEKNLEQKRFQSHFQRPIRSLIILCDIQIILNDSLHHLKSTLGFLFENIPRSQ